MVRIAMVTACLLSAAACGDDDDVDTASPDTSVTTSGDDDAGSVSFALPDSGATVARRFTVAMEASGVDIEPAGAVQDGAGHFHVMVDSGCVEPGESIPKDEQHVHFGNGRSEGQLFLEPGDHELCLQVGDGSHTALPITEERTVTVDADEPYVTLDVPDGATLTSPVAVTMSAHNVEIEPAGEPRDGAGHFHILVDVGCIEPGETIEKDETHLHFGDGSTEASLDLAPGEHVLCLQVGDGAHIASDLVHIVSVVVG